MVNVVVHLQEAPPFVPVTFRRTVVDVRDVLRPAAEVGPSRVQSGFLLSSAARKSLREATGCESEEAEPELV